MIAVDTNILVRYTMRDDPQQTKVATRFLHEHNCLVLRSVVMELVWVLSSGYSLSKKDIAKRVRQILRLSTIYTEDADNILSALRWYEKGMDFADALHLAISIGSADGLSTFDRKFANTAKRLGIKQKIYSLMRVQYPAACGASMNPFK